jgi:polysaccharide export outer membrane protein
MLKNQKSGCLKNKSVVLHKNSLTGDISCVTLLALLALTTSCGNLKQLQYLQGSIDTAALRTINYVEPSIQKGDLINITVYSDNQLASAVFNQGGSSAAGAPTSSSAPGYLVSQEGYIQLYEIGPVRVEGMSKKQLGDFLVQEYIKRNLLKNPFVEVRFLNFKITVIGDVLNPGVKAFPSDKVSIFDAIGMAGDLTQFAKRDNVLIVRETDGVRSFARLDLTDPNVFNSPFYYLHQNDMIVVDPTKQKATQTDQSFRYVSIAATIISMVAIIYSIFRP